MNRTILFILTGIGAVFFAACRVPADSTPANIANANASKPTATAPTADALLALDKQANEAYFKGDARFFEGMLSDKFVMLGPRGLRMDNAAATRMIAGVKCDIKDGWKLNEPRVSTIDVDTYVLSYKGTFDGTCTRDGKTERTPSPIRGATVWVRSGDKWLAAFHGENVIVDPKAPVAPPVKPEAEKEVSKKDQLAATKSNTASDTAAAATTKSANTDALVKIELAIWEAWKASDGKTIEELTANDLAFVDIFGTVTSGRAETIKLWTEHRCEVKSVSVTDGFASAISPNVEILTHKGTADGTCYGQKIGGPIYGTSVYVKSGDAWKLAFTLNSPD